jgi:hypothetical protein
MNKILSISAIVAAGLIGASSLTYAQGAGGGAGGSGGGAGSTMGSEASNGQGGTTAKDKKMGATHSGTSHSSMSKTNGSMAQRSQTEATPAAPMTGGDTPTKNKRTDMTKGQGGTSGTPMPATSATGNK